jgi:Na+-translocating ferredoxin:NAD+ oxidoreductase RnfD subunit
MRNALPTRSFPDRHTVPEGGYAPPLIPSQRLLHSGMTVPNYFRMHLFPGLFPLTAGLALYGWRALVSIGMVVGAAAASLRIWQHIGSRGRDLETSHGLWMALLLGLMLPAHLATVDTAAYAQSVWPIPVAAGCLLIIFLWLLGGLGVGRLHPVVVTYLVLVSICYTQLIPHWVLQHDHLASGDLLHGPAGYPGFSGTSVESDSAGSEAWVKRQSISGQDSLWSEPASGPLIAYTTGTLKPDRGQMPLHELLRDRMPPLEDLIVGGQPGPIGLGSGIAVIIGGLFLLYRGLIDYRIPLLIIVTAFIALLVLPIPTVITESGANWRWLPMRETDVRWETAVTFANYEMMASPILFVSFFLATSGPLRPMNQFARAPFAMLVGVLCAVFQLYVSVSFGPYVALLVAGLAAPELDRMGR